MEDLALDLGGLFGEGFEAFGVLGVSLDCGSRNLVLPGYFSAVAPVPSF